MNYKKNTGRENIKKMKDIELYVILAKCYNNYDIAYLEPFLDNDIRYGSQWVLQSLKGKNQFLKYFKPKLNTIQSSNNPIKAEIGFFNAEQSLNLELKELINVKGEPCIKMYQGGEPQAIILIKQKDGLINDIHICQVPHYSKAKSTNVFPK